MAKHGQNVIAYQPLIDFVNEPAVTSRNWHAAIVNMWEAWTFSRERGQAGQFPGIAKPEFRRGERITSPDPVCEVQKELRADFDRLISPAPDPLPSRFLRGLPESYKASPPHNVQWLVDKINHLSHEEKSPPVVQPDGTFRSEPHHGLAVPFAVVPVVLVPHGKLPWVRPTDRFSLVPVIRDLRIWIYFVLANLMADGLLPRLGKCKKCRRYFLAPTRARKIFCSHDCAGNFTAAERGRRYREHRKIEAERQEGER